MRSIIGMIMLLGFLLGAYCTKAQTECSFWNQYPAKGNWANFINEISHGEQDNEFYLGAKKLIFSKKNP